MLILGFVRRSNQQSIGPFELVIREQLPQINLKTMLFLYSLGFLVTLAFILSNSVFVKAQIITNLTSIGFAEGQISLLNRIGTGWFLIPTFLLTYILNKTIINSIGQKNLIFIALFTLFGLYAGMSFISNGIALLIFSILAGFCYVQIIFSLFSIALFWNCRTVKQPVVGYFCSASYFAVFLVKLINGLLLASKSDLMQAIGLQENLINYQEQINEIGSIILACAASVVLVAAVVFNFSSKYLLADFRNYKFAIQNLKAIIKNSIKQKTKTQIDFKNQTTD
ncbi:hypothetical protein SCLARK_001552 [Spiroplasma clarkii]|uniref:hypothetical protein n=1 Tax=Spiroplasma clarkii TaxID=2139 RepID=UPI000B550E4B|nr:hypothetical protein [Spiroplasma clarkii]ARU92056.1 hypothetical protein SCLARK_001552 [Spiroplasma clarkii]